MDYPSLIALVSCIGCALAMTWLPIFAWADAPPDHATRRVSNLDGLRGFVALAVVVHHGMIYRHYFLTGRWELFAPFNTMLGQGGVALFFMLTGYLFWRRLVLARGRIDWLRLYIGRVFRIGPVFLLTAGIAILVSLFVNRDMHPGVDVLIDQISPYQYIGMREAVPVRGYDTNLLLAGVMWTLQYEWFFYACLPVLALFTRLRGMHLPCAAVLFAWPLYALTYGTWPAGITWSPVYLCMFGAGALTASLQVSGLAFRSDGPVGSVLTLALLIAALFGFDRSSYPQAILVLAGFFYLVTTGCSLFGVLRMRAAHRLGHISYGLYLMQGLALATVLRPLQSVAIASPALHIAMVTAATALLTMMALLAHRYVEQPGMHVGDRIARWACAGRNRVLALTWPAAAQPSKE